MAPHTEFPTGPRGATLLGTVVAYFTGAIAAGIIVGALRPFVKGAFGLTVVAIIAAFPVTVALCTVASGSFMSWSVYMWVGVAAITIVYGVAAKVIVDDDARGKAS
jgi:hypothetical protein